ncbi:hypothetical protein [Bacillus sp. 1NLA3E]|uniref:hypothetical protein n=1 Tax=Bacillus sp. 1NLA3E TaxID=666686 RepID=UPI000247E555|nr:hypothetical protein [Bacillus sp. 1NLA3E]AGK52592.1 hypothetical protein B1NLA3E_04080 [Bacillus sp. 1NLA3E]
MNILLSLLFIVIVVLSFFPHGYFVWKKKDYKTFKVQVWIIGLAVLTGILLISDFHGPSIASTINKMSPLGK